MKPIYFIWGEDVYLLDKAIENKIEDIEKLYEDESEIIYLEADELGPLELAHSLEYSSLFSLHRIVIIKKPWWLNKASRKNKKIDEIYQVLKSYLNKEYQQQALIITALEYNKTNSIAKLINENAQIINCQKPTKDFLVNWMENDLNTRGKTITPKAAAIIANSKNDMYYIKNLIDKICLINYNKEINYQDIEYELESREEINIFRLTDAIFDRDLNQSITAFNKLILQGSHPVFILYMITRQFVDFSKVKYYKELGFSKEKVEQESGMKSFVIRKMMAKTQTFSWEEIRIVFEELLKTDILLKTTSSDEKLVMETLLVGLCK
ncbi:hypothetical protein SYNTR_1412 [Candidatus Syntrophocurvum alkaliphilum]|uniref:DNA polymerase III subunit delta n=1 Tax=Candidatus Syntrophocurvum alkaliphilum TaxID=2293317 RepID=A0A6I6DBI4_9FIRM|nr:DNA polymerase III subunit delta [Candidatus Syntrophocurvum alkaliphilum]QGU00006.1 hypothetical protein SYNTR_1412 [Candidatus Syntrophocurvum alkaliphilum]